MKRIVFALILGMMFTGFAFAGDQDFTLVNRTGAEIAELYISPASTDEWGEDVLSVDTLAAGDKCHIRFSRDETAAFWDLMIVDYDGISIEWPSVKLTAISKITITIENGEPVASYE